MVDVIVIGSGAAGMISAITAAKEGKSVLLLEQLSTIGAKLKATGGGRCNVTNTLDNEAFMASFGRDGRFMREALHAFDRYDLQALLEQIGVPTHAPDGFHVFPTTHNAVTIIKGLVEEMKRLGVVIKTEHKVTKLLVDQQKVAGVEVGNEQFLALHVIVATGGLGYPVLGAHGDGFDFATAVGHKVTDLFPAMMPLKTKERWVANCRADTIAKVELRVNLKKAKKLRAFGDLIFTKTGIRGPVVLDFAREVTPLLEKYGEVPLLVNLTKGMNEDAIIKHFKQQIEQKNDINTRKLVQSLLPESVAIELCQLAGADEAKHFSKQKGEVRNKLVSLLAWTPLTVTGHDGFKMAMITRGGVSLKEINPSTMQSKLVKGLYFCGEVMNLDGPCGGYNLQWSFSSGVLAGKLKGY
jgi:predicted Rossmann fold flavoprotein